MREVEGMGWRMKGVRVRVGVLVDESFEDGLGFLNESEVVVVEAVP